jgi:uncharacterized protein YdaL
MKKLTLAMALVFTILIAQMPVRQADAQTNDDTIIQNSDDDATTQNLEAVEAVSNRALILYDKPSGEFAKLGLVYATMLRNLLGHFNMTADFLSVDAYTAGRIENYTTTFYIGSIYDNPIPAAFLNDVRNTTKTVVWFKYNLWQIAWNPTYTFSARYGFTFSGLRGLNAAPTAQSPNPGFFDTVTYKGKALNKYYSYNANTNTIASDPDFGATQIVDPTKATALVTATNAVTNEQQPYIVRANNFWYFADLPLTYIGPRDRYLVLCDILHDILNVNHPEIHRAMVRLEDVAATVDPVAMQRLTDFLYSRNIPFSIAVIPYYRDPLGRFNGGVPMEVRFANATSLLNSLSYAKARGGSVLMHGYTHQYNAVPNIYTAVSADDFEFWNAVSNTPVLEDSTNWAKDRLNRGRNDMIAKGHTPFAWEVPHYQSSPLGYSAVPAIFDNTYQRVFYYTSATYPVLAQGASNRDFSAGMFFPYIISSDHYGQRVMPENLGNIEYDISHIDPTSNINYTWEDILLNADKGLIVRDGFGSFFFHPFWIEDELAYLNGFQHFQNLVNGMTALGYTWVSGPDLIITSTSVAPNTGPKAGGTNVTITGKGFEPGATVLFDNKQATNVVVVNPTKITCVTPTNNKGKKDVTVTNPDGRNSKLTKAFDYR